MASQSGWIQVAVSPDTYLNSIGCGACLEIDGSGQGLGNNPIKGQYKAVVTDSCPGCPANSMCHYVHNCPSVSFSNKKTLQLSGKSMDIVSV